MPTINSRLALACATTVLTLGLVACGGSTATSGATDSVTRGDSDSATNGASDSATNGASDSAANGASSSAAPVGRKVSANTASEDEIAAALEDAGVSNSERWAQEVVEYRPYPTDDPDLTRLRDNLAKYNPGQETTDEIVSALTP
jgi:hypothetical protein